MEKAKKYLEKRVKFAHDHAICGEPQYMNIDPVPVEVFRSVYYESDIDKALEIAYLEGICDGQENPITGEIELLDGTITSLNKVIDKLYDLVSEKDGEDLT